MFGKSTLQLGSYVALTTALFACAAEGPEDPVAPANNGGKPNAGGSAGTGVGATSGAGGSVGGMPDRAVAVPDRAPKVARARALPDRVARAARVRRVALVAQEYRWIGWYRRQPPEPEVLAVAATDRPA